MHTASGGVVDLALHTRRIRPLFVPLRDFRLDSQLYHTVVDLVERPPNQGGFGGNRPEVDPIEPAQHQAGGHALDRLFINPALQAHDDFHWRRVPSIRQGV